jgi:hypothetical protein
MIGIALRIFELQFQVLITCSPYSSSDSCSDLEDFTGKSTTTQIFQKSSRASPSIPSSEERPKNDKLSRTHKEFKDIINSERTPKYSKNPTKKIDENESESWRSKFLILQQKYEESQKTVTDLQLSNLYVKGTVASFLNYFLEE